MPNPYQAPGAGTVPDSRSKALASFLHGVGLVFAVLSALIPTLVLPRFQAVFKEFGADLPFLSHFVFKHSPWLWLFPVALAIASLFWRKQPGRAALVCIAGIAGFVLAIVVLIIAAYLPVMNLGAVV